MDVLQSLCSESTTDLTLREATGEPLKDSTGRSSRS